MNNPAYPMIQENQGMPVYHYNEGETIRDKDARAAMQALISAGCKPCDAAREAFWLADQMEEERSK